MHFKKITIKLESRCFFVGDLHGCYDEFMQELKNVDFDPGKDIVVSVGDLIDRGDKNLECLRLLNEPWFHAVCGNHEDMAIDTIINRNVNTQRIWIQNGGDWFFNQSEEEQFEAAELLKNKVTNLPLLIEVELPSGEKIGVAHADIHLDMWSFNKNNIETSGHLQDCVLWSRKRIHSIQRMLKGLKGTCEKSFIEGVHAMVFGHTVLKESFCYQNCLWIDTGVTYGNKLTLMSSEEILRRAYSSKEELMPEWD